MVIAQGDYDTAGSLLMECAEISEELGNEWSVPVLEGFGEIALAQNSATRAAHLNGAAAEVRERLGLTPRGVEQATYQQVMDRIRAELAIDSFEESWAKGRAMAVDEALSYAIDTTAKLFPLITPLRRARLLRRRSAS